MKRFLGRWILATCAAFGGALLPATSQAAGAPATTPTAGAPARPKVCLVLSGGGARGAAHVGVIAVLEELRVPVDCIAGTSMGALVGAAYASGMSVAEMEQVLREIDTRLLFVEKPPREEQSIRAKLDDDLDLFGFELGVRDTKLLLPKGAVSGVQLETVLRRLTKAKGYLRFDELPIPFRAVATDLVSGKSVVFSEGELANVMRASMSVPGVIAPAEFDGKMLVDGGLTDNLPVDVARRMGADIVIAVNLGTTLAPKDQLNSVVGITGQVINLLTEQNVRTSLASLKPADVLILPELGDFSAADFDHLPQTVPIGEAAARKVADRLAAVVGAANRLRRAGRCGSAPPRSSMANGSTRSASRDSNASIPNTRCRCWKPSRVSSSTSRSSTRTCGVSRAPATSSTSPIVSKATKAPVCSRSRRPRRPSVRTTCASESGCKPTSRATRSSTWRRATVARGSTSSAANGAPTSRSAARAA